MRVPAHAPFRPIRVTLADFSDEGMGLILWLARLERGATTSSMLDLERSRLFQSVGRICTFIVAESMDHEVIQPVGTGFFVAPYTVITAGHVVEAMWDETQPSWKRGRIPKGGMDRAFYAVLGHIPDPSMPGVVARWQATGAVTSAYTDIGFMHVIPVNDVAQRLEWPRFPELELIAPGVGEEVAAFGFPDVEKEELSPDLTKVTVGAKLTTGKVDEHHHSGRGSWRFPQFRADAGFAHGMSGGPVVHDGKIAGVVSYAMTLDEETHFSYAAELWPLLAAGPATGVDPRNMIPLESMLETGSITALGWRGIRDRIITGIDSSGARRIALKPPAG